MLDNTPPVYHAAGVDPCKNSIRVLVIVVLVAIVVSLGSALLHLSRGGARQRGGFRASWRER